MSDSDSVPTLPDESPKHSRPLRYLISYPMSPLGECLIAAPPLLCGRAPEAHLPDAGLHLPPDRLHLEAHLW